MPYLKTENIKYNTKFSNIGVSYEKVKIFVSNSGEFYVNLNHEYELSIKSVTDNYREGSSKKITVFSSSLDSLCATLKRIFETHNEPEVIKEPVIIYNIESHVAFAETPDGEIFPNAGYKNAEWKHHLDDKFGKHSASSYCKNGYSLTIGAQAKMKTTYRYGNKEKVEYEYYYKDGNHLGKTNPAERLNSWTSFHFENFKEIPYSDEAAEFFYNMMFGMARLSKLIQDSTFDQENLLKLISSGSGFFLPNKKIEEK